MNLFQKQYESLLATLALQAGGTLVIDLTEVDRRPMNFAIKVENGKATLTAAFMAGGRMFGAFSGS